MPASLVEVWNSELSEAISRKRRAWMRGVLYPRILVLPAVWGGYGAWTIGGHIFITVKQAQCPEHVRRYVIGHELGHLYGGHVYLQLLFMLSYCALVVGELSRSAITVLALGLTCILYIAFVTPSMALAREYFADSVSVELYGINSTLTSSLWMARHVDDVHTRERQARLQRLRAHAGLGQTFIDK